MADLEEVLFDLESDIPEIKRAALIELARIGTEKEIDLLQDMMGKTDSEMEGYIQKAIEAINSRNSVAQIDENSMELPWDISSLVLMLNDDHSSIREAVIKRLIELEDPSSARYLATRLRLEDDLKIKNLLINAIGKLGTEDEASILIKLLNEGDSKIIPDIIKALGNIGGIDPFKALIPFLNEHSRFKEIAKESIFKMEPSQIESGISGAIQCEDLMIREEAINIIDELSIAPLRLQQLLLSTLSDNDSNIRLKGINLLGDKGDNEQVISALENKKRLADLRERKAIEEALDKIRQRCGIHGSTDGEKADSHFIDEDPLARVLKTLGSAKGASAKVAPQTRMAPMEKTSQIASEAANTVGGGYKKNMDMPENPVDSGTWVVSGPGMNNYADNRQRAPETVNINENKTQKGIKYVRSMDDLMGLSVKKKASDLHLRSGYTPILRIGGSIREENLPKLKPENMIYLVDSIIDGEEREQLFEKRQELDLSLELSGTRFRVNVFHEKNGLALVLRVIPSKILTLEQLNCPTIIGNLCERSKGLILVVGPTGSGKSTTLAAMIDHVNRLRSNHIITVEDPIEFVHTPDKCLITQRELRTNTPSFASALRASLRQDPDIILVGEMRDLETIELALTAAETGHLVFSTLHTQGASQTLDRIIQVFPANQQEQIRVLLSETLVAVVSQTLLPLREDKDKRIAAFEVMISNSAVRNLIREDKTFQIESTMSTSKGEGMILMDDYLFKLFKDRIVSLDEIVLRAKDKDRFLNVAKDSYTEAVALFKKGELDEEGFRARCLDEARGEEFLKAIKGIR